MILRKPNQNLTVCKLETKGASTITSDHSMPNQHKRVKKKKNIDSSQNVLNRKRAACDDQIIVIVDHIYKFFYIHSYLNIEIDNTSAICNWSSQSELLMTNTNCT